VGSPVYTEKVTGLLVGLVLKTTSPIKCRVIKPPSPSRLGQRFEQTPPPQQAAFLVVSSQIALASELLRRRRHGYDLLVFSPTITTFAHPRS